MKRFFLVVYLAVLLPGLFGCQKSAANSKPIPETTQILETEATVMETIPETTEETLAPTEPEKCVPSLTDPKDADLVNIREYIPDIYVELRYGSEDNFTGQRIYSFTDAYLRYGTVQKLAAVREELKEFGLHLKIWDAFRPVSAQFVLWEVYPDPNYVANPNAGFSAHSRGNTVDVTLVDEQGREVEMPTLFDDFSALADRDYSDCTPAAAENAGMLEDIMHRHGFKGYWGEWWHFSDTQSYDVETCFDPSIIGPRYAECQEFITLRSAPSTAADAIMTIPKDGQMLFFGYLEEFSLVEYKGRRGYVLTAYTRVEQ